MDEGQNRRGLWMALGLVLVVGGGGVVGFAMQYFGPQEAIPYDVVGFEPMTADQVHEEFFLIAPEMLTAVYLAFNETEEASIYDSLAVVAADNALEALYLERVGAMVGGGLDPSEEADQEIHTMEMIRLDNDREGEEFHWNARWRVVGTVGHATHMHVRGNIYAANLVVAPVEGRWRIREFELTDIDRSEVGQMVAAEP